MGTGKIPLLRNRRKDSSVLSALCPFFTRDAVMSSTPIQRARSERRQLRRLLRTGRISLVIGLLFLAAAMILGDLASGLVGRYDYGEILAHSLLIGGWVALWRPIEIFLYDWWPIGAEARLYDRLSNISVSVHGDGGADQTHLRIRRLDPRRFRGGRSRAQRGAQQKSRDKARGHVRNREKHRLAVLVVIVGPHFSGNHHTLRSRAAPVSLTLS